MFLSSSQIEFFNENGCVYVDDVFSKQEIEDLRLACESSSIQNELRRRGSEEKLLHLLELTSRHPSFLQLVYDKRITNFVSQLIGDNLQLQHSKLATKPPVQGRGTSHWHQDFAFFPHTNTSLVAVSVMLDDATIDNGCMQVASGSHRKGVLDHSEEGYFVGKYQGTIDNTLINLTPKAGGLSIHHCLSLHGSPENRSSQPRRMIVLQYRAGDSFQLGADTWTDTGLQVLGECKNEVRCDTGVVSLPKRRTDIQPFGNTWNQLGGFAQAMNWQNGHLFMETNNE